MIYRFPSPIHTWLAGIPCRFLLLFIPSIKRLCFPFVYIILDLCLLILIRLDFFFQLILSSLLTTLPEFVMSYSSPPALSLSETFNQLHRNSPRASLPQFSSNPIVSDNKTRLHSFSKHYDLKLERPSVAETAGNNSRYIQQYLKNLQSSTSTSEPRTFQNPIFPDSFLGPTSLPVCPSSRVLAKSPSQNTLTRSSPTTTFGSMYHTTQGDLSKANLYTDPFSAPTSALATRYGLDPISPSTLAYSSFAMSRSSNNSRPDLRTSYSMGYISSSRIAVNSSGSSSRSFNSTMTTREAKRKQTALLDKDLPPLPPLPSLPPTDPYTKEPGSCDIGIETVLNAVDHVQVCSIFF